MQNDPAALADFDRRIEELNARVRARARDKGNVESNCNPERPVCKLRVLKSG